MLFFHTLCLLILTIIPLNGMEQIPEDPARRSCSVLETKAPSQTCMDCTQTVKKARTTTTKVLHCLCKEAYSVAAYIAITLGETYCCLCSDCTEIPPHDN